MKPLHKIDLIFSVNGKTVAIQPVEGWTVQDVTALKKIMKEFYPERTCQIEPRREVRR